MLTTVEGLRYGQLVCSTAGRDLGQYYLIWDLVGEKFIQVVDGSYHPIAKPKKKNIKHVKIMMLVAKEIEETLLRAESVNDTAISAAIQRMKNELEEGDRFHG